jgi:hypothetical protein
MNMTLCIMPSWVSLFFEIMDNTFLGTLCAGILLALFGFHLYRKQKVVDIKYEDLRRVRDAASLLLASIEIAFKKYEEQLNIYTNKDGQLYLIKEIKSKLKDLGQFPDDEIMKDFQKMTYEISNNTDSLIALLQIKGNYNKDIEKIIKNVATFNFFVGSAHILHLFDAKILEEHRKRVSESLKIIRITLKEIIEQK